MEEAKTHRIRITLTSRSIKDLEKVRAAPACVKLRLSPVV